MQVTHGQTASTGKTAGETAFNNVHDAVRFMLWLQDTSMFRADVRRDLFALGVDESVVTALVGSASLHDAKLLGFLGDYGYRVENDPTDELQAALMLWTEHHWHTWKLLNS